MAEEQKKEQPSFRYFGLDVIVAVLAVTFTLFLIVTMGIRTDAARLVTSCQYRLTALAQAQQMYLVKNGEFAADLATLRPFLDPEDAKIPFSCPITGNVFLVRVQGDKYKIVAPGTEYSITTGDPSW